MSEQAFNIIQYIYLYRERPNDNLHSDTSGLAAHP